MTAKREDPATGETIDLRMTWKQSAEILLLALENGTGEGKAMAREEVRRMAAILDELREGASGRVAPH